MPPDAAIRNPMAAGPISRVTLMAIEFSERALSKSLPSSSCGIKEVRTGWFKAIPKPRSNEVR